MRISTRTLKQSDSLSRLTATRSNGFLLAALPLVLAMAIWPFGGGHKVIMTSAESVPSAKATIYVNQDRNKNTQVDMKVRFLAHPSALTPPEIAYVVWIQENDRPAENKGELHVDGNLNGEFKTVSPYKAFTIFVTAEQSPQVQSPRGDQVLTAQVAE